MRSAVHYQVLQAVLVFVMAVLIAMAGCSARTAAMSGQAPATSSSALQVIDVTVSIVRYHGAGEFSHDDHPFVLMNDGACTASRELFGEVKDLRAYR